MQTIERIYLPLLRQVEWPKINILETARSLGNAMDFYRSALSVTYLTALRFGQRNDCPHDADLDGRDPRW